MIPDGSVIALSNPILGILLGKLKLKEAVSLLKTASYFLSDDKVLVRHLTSEIAFDASKDKRLVYRWLYLNV
jgi:hypothetical protein